MTGDETNNIPIKRTVRVNDYLKPISSDPLASNTGKELKPCPFCGKPGKEWIDRGAKVYGCSDFEYCNRARPSRELLDSWNNAWAHKRIAELQADTRKRQEIAVDYCMKIASLESALAKLAAVTKQKEDFKDMLLFVKEHGRLSQQMAENIDECLKERPL